MRLALTGVDRLVTVLTLGVLFVPQQSFAQG